MDCACCLQALEREIVDCLWKPDDPQCVQESEAAAGKVAALKSEAISRRIDRIEQSVLGWSKVSQICVLHARVHNHLCLRRSALNTPACPFAAIVQVIQVHMNNPSYRAPIEEANNHRAFTNVRLTLLLTTATRAVDAILQHPFLSLIFHEVLEALPDIREEMFEGLEEEEGAEEYRALLKSIDLRGEHRSLQRATETVGAVRAMCKKRNSRDVPSIIKGLLALSSLYRSRLEQFNGLASAKEQMSFIQDKLLVCCIPLSRLPQRVLLCMYKLFSALRGHVGEKEARSEAEKCKCKEVFEMIDVNGDKKLSRAEVIKVCRANEGIRTLLGLPANIRQEDGTRDQFEKVFQQMDQDDSKEVDADEFEDFWFTVILPGHQSNEGKFAHAFASARQNSSRNVSAEAKAAANRAESEEAVKASRQAEEANRQAARQEAADAAAARRSSSTEQSPSSSLSPARLSGKRVLLQNLCSRSDLNNKVGLAGEFDELKGRYVVSIDGETLSLLAENLVMEGDDEDKAGRLADAMFASPLRQGVANAAAGRRSHMASASPEQSDKYSQRMTRARCHNLNSQASAHAESGAATPSSNFVGKPVQLRNLSSRKDLNGKIAQATDFDEEKGRYVVTIDGKTLSLKPENLGPSGADAAASNVHVKYDYDKEAEYI